MLPSGWRRAEGVDGGEQGSSDRHSVAALGCAGLSSVGCWEEQGHGAGTGHEDWRERPWLTRDQGGRGEMELQSGSDRAVVRWGCGEGRAEVKTEPAERHRSRGRRGGTVDGAGT